MSRPLILLVDETEFFLGIERQFLRHSDVAVLTTSHPDNTLELVRQHHPALVYMDRGAPEMSGARSCAAIKADPALRATPVILVCSDSQDERQFCRGAGCDAIMVKPLDRKEFLAAGRRFLPKIDRREQRVLCYTTIFYRHGRGHAYGKSVDLSVGGIFVETEDLLQVDERIELSFTLPGLADRLLELRGRVIWVNDPCRPCRSSFPGGFGVEFFTPDPATLQVLRNFVEEHSPHQQRIRGALLKPGLQADALQ